ncbi:MAG: hypothetical protein GF398_16950 [Chitinivibrionales bacterium]|nr:hypothetical protein [Chitinivibrionales bacterium]
MRVFRRTIEAWYGLWVLMLLVLSCSNPFSVQQDYPRSYHKGMNVFFMSHRNAFKPADFKSNIAEIESTGVTHVYLIPYFFSPDESSDTIFPTEETINHADLDHAIRICLESGLTPILKPHIDLLNKTPRFNISPSDGKSWKRNYLDFIDPYLQLSEQYALSCFVIATELDNVVNASWFEEIIAHARRAYSGELIYAASFDHFLECEIWDKVDKIGINAYYNLSNSDRDCTMAALSESWNHYLQVITDFSILKGKAVILTEVGYCSKQGSSINPGNWHAGTDISPQHQAHAYEALLMQAARFDRIKGIYWWQWELNGVGGMDNIDYTPKNKPAEDILRNYWN